MSETKSLDAAAVLEFLRSHPEFLLEHPRLLEEIRVPHGVDGTTSLIEHQVSVLQDKTRSLNARLREYHQTAEHNESLLRRVHQFYMHLINIDDIEVLLNTVESRLKHDFECAHVSMALFEPLACEGARVLGASASSFESLRRNQRAVCGRISAERLALLFSAEEAAGIASGALVPIGAQPFGVLVLGSTDEHKFYPGMGTLFLELLGQMLGETIKRLVERREPVAS